MTSLTKLSDQRLLAKLEALVDRERKTTLEVVLHIGEVERRRLYLGLAYSSMYDYCIEHLGYSASAAGRRIQTARCIRRFPEALRMLRKGELNLSTVCLLAPVISEENKRELLARARRKSQREVEAIVSRYRPPAIVRDEARPVRVLVPASPGAPTNRTRVSEYSRSGSGERSTITNTTPCTERTALKAERKMQLTFAASEAFMQKLEEARALLSNKLGPGAGFEQIFEAGLDALLDKHSPRKRNERREKRRKKAMEHPAPSTPRGNGSKHDATRSGGGNDSQKPPPKRARHIPAVVRDDVFARDGGKCTFTAANGKRCGSTAGLHVDHIVPFAKGGSNDASNLRLLCANHNRHEAERAYGREFMKQYRRRE